MIARTRPTNRRNARGTESRRPSSATTRNRRKRIPGVWPVALDRIVPARRAAADRRAQLAAEPGRLLLHRPPDLRTAEDLHQRPLESGARRDALGERLDGACKVVVRQDPLDELLELSAARPV